MRKPTCDVNPNTVSGAASFLIQYAEVGAAADPTRSSAPAVTDQIRALSHAARTGDAEQRPERIRDLIDMVVGDLRP